MSEISPHFPRAQGISRIVLIPRYFNDLLKSVSPVCGSPRCLLCLRVLFCACGACGGLWGLRPACGRSVVVCGACCGSAWSVVVCGAFGRPTAGLMWSVVVCGATVGPPNPENLMLIKMHLFRSAIDLFEFHPLPPGPAQSQYSGSRRHLYSC